MFEELTKRHVLALVGFLFAKLFGMFGFFLGFGGGEMRTLGGVFIGLAIVAIFFSIGMSLIQTRADALRFAEEDALLEEQEEV